MLFELKDLRAFWVTKPLSDFLFLFIQMYAPGKVRLVTYR